MLSGETVIGLTDRQTDVLVYVAKGFTNKEIGALMNLNHETINDHVRRIFKRLQLNRRVECAVWAAKQGLV